MAKTSKQYTEPDFARYEGAQVAQNYLQAGDLARANLALLSTQINDDGKLLLQNDPHYRNKEGISTAVTIFGSQFHAGLYGMTFAQLKDFYRTPLSEMKADVRKATEALFDKYAGKKLGDVETAYMDAAERLSEKGQAKYRRDLSEQVEKGKLDEVFKAGIKKAEKIRAEYESLVQVRHLLQEARNVPIERTTRNSLLEQLVSN